MIENKEMLLYSAKKAVNHISKVGAENANDKECFFIIGTALHWVIDCIDRIPDTQIKDYGTYFIWTSLDEVNVWESKENQRMNYKKNFEGKNVFITMSEIMSEIEKYYEIL